MTIWLYGSKNVLYALPEGIKFDPVKYVEEIFSRGEKPTLLHFCR